MCAASWRWSSQLQETTLIYIPFLALSAHLCLGPRLTGTHLSFPFHILYPLTSPPPSCTRPRGFGIIAPTMLSARRGDYTNGVPAGARLNALMQLDSAHQLMARVVQMWLSGLSVKRELRPGHPRRPTERHNVDGALCLRVVIECSWRDVSHVRPNHVLLSRHCATRAVPLVTHNGFLLFVMGAGVPTMRVRGPSRKEDPGTAVKFLHLASACLPSYSHTSHDRGNQSRNHLPARTLGPFRHFRPRPDAGIRSACYETYLPLPRRRKISSF